MNNSVGEDIRARLRKYSLTNVWLVQQLKARGIDICPSALSLALSGYRTGECYQKALVNSVAILDKYEQDYLSIQSNKRI